MNNRRPWGAALACMAAGALACGQVLGGPLEDSAAAEKEFARGDLIAAIAFWTKAAEKGHAPAQARLGDIMDKSEEDDEAVIWYGKAAAQNDAHGQYGMGLLYAKGGGVKQDFAKAREWLFKAAAQNYPPALVSVYEAYRTGGFGLEVDTAKAAEWEAKVKAVLPNYGLQAPVASARARTVRETKRKDAK